MSLERAARLRVGSREFVLAGLVWLGLLAAGSAGGQAPARQEALDRLLAAARAKGDTETEASSARVTWSPGGVVRFLAAPRGTVFPVAAGPGDAAAQALDFLQTHRSLFGMDDPRMGLTLLRTRERGARHHTRFQETVSGVPVFGAQVNVQTALSGGVEAVLADVAVRLDGLSSLNPRLGAEEAQSRGLAEARSRGSAQGVEARPPVLYVFCPAVLGLEGPSVLVWLVDVGIPGGGSFRLLLDAGDGSTVREYPLEYSALDRQIYDCNNTYINFATFVRDEGDPPCGIADADAAYDQIGYTYLFYLTHHSRDGFDDGGGILRASVRYCPGPVCPWENAVWDGYYGNIKYGDGWTVDDITAHEFTHGVTESESGLIYENASGAMNESFSDVWGEFVDLESPAGGFDDPSLRWLIGEALPDYTLRSMSDPPAYGNPDRLGSTLVTPPPATPSQWNDYGGVHNNSGINNKLCYLLTDGGSFNGQAITGKGIAAVANLYYEVNANLLTPAADWVDLFNALMQAALNLGWSAADRENLRNACTAVEIGIYVVDQASTCPIQTGIPSCSGLIGPFQTVLTGYNAVAPGSTLQIRGGIYPENLTLTKGVWLRSGGGVVRLGQ
jgi:Zn-dependent metalloprotease